MKSINNIKSDMQTYSDDDDGYVNVTNKRNKSSRLIETPSKPFETPSKPIETPSRSIETPSRSIQAQPQSNVSFANEAPKRGRDLSAFGDDVQRSREVYNEKQESRQNRPRYQPAYLREEPKKEPEEKSVKINTEDTQLFPTLNINNIAAPKKLSAWSTFKVDNLVEKIAQTEKDAETQKQLNIKMNLTSSNTNKDSANECVRNTYVDSDGEEYYSDDDEEDDEERYDDIEMDSVDIYMREKYIKRDELYNNIRYVKSKFNKYNVDHINFLRRLQIEYANIDDEIYRHEEDENTLEREYGTGSYSLFEEAKRKREEDEEKLKEPQKILDFLKMLASVK